MSLRPGDRVVHRNRGPGRVLTLKPGLRARVRLDAVPDLPWTFPVAELTAELLRSRDPQSDGGTTERTVPAAARPASTITFDGAGVPGVSDEDRPGALGPLQRSDGSERDPARLASLQQAIEALRLGVVPAEHVRDYTVVRDVQLGRIGELLEQGSGMRVVWGDYGAGKTHLLDIAEELGRRANFLTARIVLDPREVPPTHPKLLYSALVEHIRYPGDLALGLEPLFRRLVDTGSHGSPDGIAYSRFYSPFVFALKAGDPDTLDWMRDYVDGCYMDVEDGNRRLRRGGWRGDRLLAMSNFRTYGRMYVHLLGNVASWARDAGYGGLLLLFDEVEFVDALTPGELDYALEVLRHFSAVTVPRTDLDFDPDHLYRGGHRVHQQIPLRYREDQPLAVVFALTPLNVIRRIFRQIVRSPEYDVEITSLGRADCEELVKRIEALCRRAYPEFEPSRETLEDLHREMRRCLDEGEDSPRAIVRATVFHLDRARLDAKAARRA